MTEEEKMKAYDEAELDYLCKLVQIFSKKIGRAVTVTGGIDYGNVFVFAKREYGCQCVLRDLGKTSGIFDEIEEKERAIAEED